MLGAIKMKDLNVEKNKLEDKHVYWRGKVL